MDIPQDRFYSKEHLWCRLADGAGLVGITAHAQAELGEIVYVDLPAAGAPLVRGEPFGSIESIKAVSDLIAPVSGTVAAANADLAAHPGLVNSSPYDQGWLVRLEPVNEAEARQLMDAAAYRACLGA